MATYNNGATAVVGDAVITLGNDYSSVLSGKVIAIRGANIQLDTHAALVPAFNAIKVADAHPLATTGISAPSSTSGQAPVGTPKPVPGKKDK